MQERAAALRPRAVLVVIGIVLATGGALWFLWLTRRVLVWIVIAAFLATALNPAVDALMRRGVRRRGVAVGIVYAGAVLQTGGRIHLRDAVFDDNRGGEAGHVFVDNRFSASVEVVLEDVTLWRAGPAPFGVEYEEAALTGGPAIGVNNPSREVATTVTLVGVDFGDGPTENGMDWDKCPSADFVGVVDATLIALSGPQLCP